MYRNNPAARELPPCIAASNGRTCGPSHRELKGEHESALATAREGLKVQDETGYGLWNAELHRLEGISLLGLNRLDEGQRALDAALRVAQRQQAKAYELRAATSLARLWGEQGRRADAYDLLAPVYGWLPKALTRSI